MRQHLLPLLLCGLVQPAFSQNKSLPELKQSAVRSIEQHSTDLIRLSDQVWAFAETALKETRSSKVLADYAEQQGFTVERGVAGMPTAFVASYGSGKPVIGILGEYDALPGLSQKTVPRPEVLTPGAAGHGCGHNMFAPASLGAAIAIKELIQAGKLSGTIRFYGTPAEESVGGKIYMVRDGYFKDLDVCLDWHPDSEIKAGVQSSQALVDFTVEFTGKSAHAAYDPWNGRSALDGVEAFTHGVNMLREHVRPTVRMHYVVKHGGDVPNVIPASASVWMWVRDSKRSGVEDVFKRVQQIAKGAADIAGVEYTVRINGGDYELLVNRAGAAVMQRNLELLGPILYTPEETTFAKQIQAASGVPQTGMDGSIKPLEATRENPEGGSTDVGDVSWNVPEISLVVSTAPAQTPWHSWPVVACGGMSIGHKGMLYASQAMALTMIDLFQSTTLRDDIRQEFLQKKGDHVYKAYIPDGPPPVEN